jgi:putative addiction module component (TIGR02574 family)
MNQISVADILEMPVQERIQLVEVIWESIAAFPNAIEVSPELKSELEVRLADFEQNPEAGYSWDQVKAHLKAARGVPLEIFQSSRSRNWRSVRLV